MTVWPSPPLCPPPPPGGPPPARAPSAASAAGTACPPLDYQFWWIVHGALMAFAFGVALPLGVLVARALKGPGPAWFVAHRLLVSAGLMAALAGWIIIVGWFCFPSGAQPTLKSAHVIVGWCVLCVALLQPFVAAFKPDKGTPARKAWNWLHKPIGYFAFLGGAANVMVGLVLYWSFYAIDSGLWAVVLYSVWLGLFAALWLGLEIRACRRPPAASEPAAAAAPHAPAYVYVTTLPPGVPYTGLGVPQYPSTAVPPSARRLRLRPRLRYFTRCNRRRGGPS